MVAQAACWSRMSSKDPVSGPRSHSPGGTRATVFETPPSGVTSRTATVSRAFVPGGVANPMSPGGDPNDSAAQILAPIRVIATTCLRLPPSPGSVTIRPNSPDREKTEKRPRLTSYAGSESGPWGSSETGRPNSPGPEPRLPMRLVLLPSSSQGTFGEDGRGCRYNRFSSAPTRSLQGDRNQTESLIGIRRNPHHALVPRPRKRHRLHAHSVLRPLVRFVHSGGSPLMTARQTTSDDTPEESSVQQLQSPSYYDKETRAWKELKPGASQEAEPGNDVMGNLESFRSLLLASLQMRNLVVFAGSGTSLGQAGGPSMSDLWNSCPQVRYQLPPGIRPCAKGIGPCWLRLGNRGQQYRDATFPLRCVPAIASKRRNPRIRTSSEAGHPEGMFRVPLRCQSRAT